MKYGYVLGLLYAFETGEPQVRVKKAQHIVSECKTKPDSANNAFVLDVDTYW